MIQWLTNQYYKLFRRLFQQLPSPTEFERDCIISLREEFASLPLLPIKSGSSQAAAQWNKNRRKLRDAIQSDDPRHFLSIPTVRSAMFFEDQAFAQIELAELRDQPNFLSRWQPQLTDRIPIPSGAKLVDSFNPNLVHQAYHLLQLERVAGLRIETLNTVLEFGGGYGALCGLAAKLGFVGAYMVFDLPEFLLLQKFYLSLNSGADFGTGHQSDYRPVAQVKHLTSMLTQKSLDLFVAMWSLSEVEEALRSEFIAVLPSARFILLGVQDRFGEVDNIGWFKRWTDWQVHHEWTSIRIRHLPHSRYIIGRRYD